MFMGLSRSRAKIRSQVDTFRGVEAIGPLIVGQESNFGIRKVEKHMEVRSSLLIKGKKDLASSRATKWMAKSDIGGVGKLIPNTISSWTPRDKTGDGECSMEPF